MIRRGYSRIASFGLSALRPAVRWQRRETAQGLNDDPDLQLEYYRQWAEYYRRWHMHYYGGQPEYQPGASPHGAPPPGYSHQYQQPEQPAAGASSGPQEDARNNPLVWALLLATGLYVAFSIEVVTDDQNKPLPANGLRESQLAHLQDRAIKRLPKPRKPAAPSPTEAPEPPAPATPDDPLEPDTTKSGRA